MILNLLRFVPHVPLFALSLVSFWLVAMDLSSLGSVKKHCTGLQKCVTGQAPSLSVVLGRFPQVISGVVAATLQHLTHRVAEGPSNVGTQDCSYS